MFNRIIAFFKSKEIIVDNAVETRANIVNAIISALKSLRYKKNNFRSLNLYLIKKECSNSLVMENIVGELEFEDYLRAKLENSGIDLGSRWAWNFGDSDLPGETISVGDGLYISILSRENSIAKASIEALTGELEQEKYILDPSVTKNFNIGRGKVMQLDNGIFHKNLIVIKDPSEPGNIIDDNNKELNSSVSRAHATIIYSKQNGFLLKVLPGGCWEAKNQTHIFRENLSIPVNNTLLPVALLDNDQIKIGRKVILLFRIPDNEADLDLGDEQEKKIKETIIPKETEPLHSYENEKKAVTVSDNTESVNSEETTNTEKKATDVVSENLLFDYCIIDTNIWMETHDMQLYHQRLEALKDLYKIAGKKIVAHGSTYEELKRFADVYRNKIKDRDRGLNPKIMPKEFCAQKGFSLLKRFTDEKMVRIPGLQATHDTDAYADKDIYFFASMEYEKGRSILFITNDTDCGRRVYSKLEDLKNTNSTLAKFDVFDMQKLSKLLYKINEK